MQLVAATSVTSQPTTLCSTLMLRPLAAAGLVRRPRTALNGLRHHHFLPGVCNAAKKGSGGGSSSSSSSGGSIWGTPPAKKTAKSNGGGVGKQRVNSKSSAPAQGKKQQPKQQPKQQAPAKPQKQEQQAAPAAAAQPQQAGVTKLSPPLQQQLLEVLSPWESAPAPRWGTFCNHLEGEWVGQYCALTPWAGDPEPVWADPQGKYVTHVYTRTLESRLEDDGSNSSSSSSGNTAASSSSSSSDSTDGELRDLMTRVVARGATAEAVAALQLPRGMPPVGGSSSNASNEGSADDYESLEVEAWSDSDYGTVIFDGGSYSLGPEYIGALDDDELAVAAGGGSSTSEAVALQKGNEEDKSSSRGGSSSSSDASSSRTWENDGWLVKEEEGAFGADDAGDDDEAGSSVPSRTFIVEQCLCLGGDARVRLKATLKTRTAPGEEMDVEVARVVLCKEHWYGLPSAPSDPTPSPALQLLPSHDLRTPITAAPRPTPAQLTGDWNVFTFCATAVEDVDMSTGRLGPMWVYSGREEKRAWSVLGGGEDGVEQGGSYWLPGGVVATIRMVPQAQQQQQELAGAVAANASASSNGTSRGSNGASASTNGSNASTNGSSASTNGSSASSGVGAVSAPRGLVLSLVWLLDAKTALLMERTYDGQGTLLEVSQGTAVRGGWSGGRM